jgi:hypothetical protein
MILSEDIVNDVMVRVGVDYVPGPGGPMDEKFAVNLAFPVHVRDVPGFEDGLMYSDDHAYACATYDLLEVARQYLDTVRRLILEEAYSLYEAEQGYHPRQYWMWTDETE